MTATQWLEVLVSYSLQVLVVVAAGKMLERRITRSADRCALWHTCFLSVLMLGGAALLLPRLHLIQPWSRMEPHTLLVASAAQAVMGRLLLVIWSVGAGVSLFGWIARGQRLRRTLRRCERLPEREVEAMIGAVGDASVEQKRPAVLVSDEIDGPFCWQLHEPTVVLPRFLLAGSRDDLRHVLAHELEHLKTNHPLQLFLQHLAQVVCWFHPAVWRAGARAGLLREFACDETAAAQGANSAAYLRTLLRIAERCEQRGNASALGFGRTPSEIVLRARRLVSLAREGPARGRGWNLGRKSASAVLLAVACSAFLLWIPCDPLASSRSAWSPWPQWTASSLHCFGCSLRDYELFDRRTSIHELLHERATSMRRRPALLANGAGGP